MSLFARAYLEISEGLSLARDAGVVCGPILSLSITKQETTMTKLTDDELVEMKAIGYIEGNEATIPDALKVGQELHDKVAAHEAALAKKSQPKPVDDAPASASKAPVRKAAPRKTAKGK